MLGRIDAPENVLAFRAVGKVEKSDYETVLNPAVEATIGDRDEVRFVYVLGEAFDGYTERAGHGRLSAGTAELQHPFGADSTSAQ